MKSEKRSIAGSRKPVGRSVIYSVLAICHYLFGLCALLSSIMMAISDTIDIKNANAIISIACIILFALTQPDIKFRRMQHRWRFMDEKLN